jgi:hypothetical protein
MKSGPDKDATPQFHFDIDTQNIHTIAGKPMIPMLAIDPAWYLVGAYIGGALVLAVIIAKFLKR